MVKNREFVSCVLGAICVLWTAYGQLSQDSRTPEAIKFMKTFGYLADGGPNSEALYSEKGITSAIKKMQEYGGLVPTGVLDQATLALMTKPRCGVRDVEPDSNLGNKKRRKRYVLASEGWTKDTITYRVDNFPKRISRETTMRKFRDAFDVWSKISPLKFFETNGREADMEIIFRDGQHGDKYPFDGTGNILAHAFFPHRSSLRGGDVHFDSEEKWADLSTNYQSDIDTVDLFTVASHEIGHALGLAHSNDTEALMFPYYKGYTEPDKIIGNDDKLAMRQLYRNLKSNSVNNGEVSRITTRAPTRRSTPRRRITRPTRRTASRRRNTRPPRRTTPKRSARVTRRPIARVTRPRPRIRRPLAPREPPVTTRKPTRVSHDQMPHLCDGSFDAMAVVRGELMIFKRNFMWRFRVKGRLLPGYPVEFKRFFYKFPAEITKIDAIYERSSDGKIVFFTGAEYWVYDGSRFIENSPQPLQKLGLPAHVQKIDASLHKAKEKITYLFYRNEYYKFNETTKCVESRVPERIDRRSGLQEDIDNALEWTDGRSYIFKRKHFWSLKDNEMRVEEQFLNKSPEIWAGCNP